MTWEIKISDKYKNKKVKVSFIKSGVLRYFEKHALKISENDERNYNYEKIRSHSSSKSKNVICFLKSIAKKKYKNWNIFRTEIDFNKKVFFYRWVHKRATRK